MATLTIADLDNGKRDLQTIDEVANSRKDTTPTRFGDQTLTLYGALRRLGYSVPVAYAPGLSVDSGPFTVERDGVVYAPVVSLVPFTTEAWDASQWRVVQNTNDDRRAFVFSSKLEADIAATTLPEGQYADSLDVQERYRVQAGALVFVERLRSVKIGTAKRPLESKVGEHFSILDAGGVGDDATNNAAAFAEADTKGAVFVPAGTFLSDGYLPTGLYFGPGKIRLSGVTGFNGLPLAYTYDLDPSTPTQISTFVMQYGSAAQEQAYNVRIGQDVAPNHKLTDGFVVAVGGRVLNASGTNSGEASAYRVTALGGSALRRATSPYSVTAIGDSSMENGEDMERSVAVGSNSAQFAGDKTPQLHHHEFHSGTNNDPYGLEARNSGFRGYVGAFGSPINLPTSGSSVTGLVALGRNAYLHGVASVSDTAVGYNAMAHAWNTYSNVALGTGALRDGVAVNHNVALGFNSSAQTQTGYRNVTVGSEAGALNVHGHSLTLLGYRAGYNLSGNSPDQATAVNACRQVVAIGALAMQNSTQAVNMVAVGNAAFSAANGSGQSVAVGVLAGTNLVTGNNNTYIGYSSGVTRIDGSNNTSSTNTTCIGFNSKISGDNQVQLGDAQTTVYAYGTVQNRSDARDKADVRDTVLGLDFINALRPVDFKWDMRDDYVQHNEDGTVEILSKDGSKKRNRYHHGVIAQELRAVMEKHGVDFGGFQDHSVNGGCDVLSVGYTELIAPLIKAVQELSARVKELEEH